MKDTIFSPSFGNRPTQLVGRDGILSEVMDGLSSMPGSKERSVVILGQRGMGKTVLLWELAERARSLGFVVASPTVVSDSMLERIVEKVQDDGERFIKGERSQIVGGSIGALGFSAGLQFSEQAQESKSFGYKILKLAQALDSQGHGLLILVDELQANSSALRQLIIAYAELVGEGLDVAIVFAGLPGSVSSVLNDRVLTFLNRSRKMPLGPLPIGEVDAFYARTFEKAGIAISPELRRKASRATEGSPYMLQLVGHNLMRYAKNDSTVDAAVLQDALHASRDAFREDVCRTTVAALSERDVDFLRAMAEDDGPSRTSEIARRLGVADDYAQKYRRRLIDGGIIAASRRGYVEFDVPYLKEYLAQAEG